MTYSIGDYGDMIADTVRMDPFAFALRKEIRPNSVVLDIGTGSGIHALMACKFGARKVYAIEPNDAIHLARELAEQNGFSDRIEFFQDVSTHIVLPEKADVIVSDIRGVLPLYGAHIPSIIDARQRHLAPGGVLIPKHDTIRVSLVEAPEVYNEITAPWDYPYGFSMKKAEQIVLNDWGEESNDSFSKRDLLMEPQVWAELDYMSIESPNIGSSTLIQKATRVGVAHGLLLWFDAEIAEGIFISNDPRAERTAKVYGCGFFPLLEPVAVAKGDRITLNIQADLINGQYEWAWQTRIHSGEPPQTIKAHFEQSTQQDDTLKKAVLHRNILDFRPNLTEAGEIDLLILGMMDGRHTIEEIAEEAQAKYPVHFKTKIAAQFYVNVLSREFGC
jgi:protein arginine N-methyltransferase 1